MRTLPIKCLPLSSGNSQPAERMREFFKGYWGHMLFTLRFPKKFKPSKLKLCIFIHCCVDMKIILARSILQQSFKE